MTTNDGKLAKFSKASIVFSDCFKIPNSHGLEQFF